MKKKIRKQISAKVAHLPPMKYRAIIRGSLGKSDGSTLPSESKVASFPVSHIKRAKRAYEKGGWPAVERYLRSNTPKKESNKETIQLS